MPFSLAASSTLSMGLVIKSLAPVSSPWAYNVGDASWPVIKMT